MKLFGLFLLLLLVKPVFSQDLTDDLFFKSTFVVEGTSNDHAWVLKCNVADLNVIVSPSEFGYSITRFKGKVPVAELKNDNPLMTQDAYQALKGYEFPYINFELTKVLAVAKKNSEILGTVTLEIAGEKADVDFVVKAEQSGEGIVKISGWKGVKMTDFGVQPPRFFNGAIQAHDDIVIRFEMNVPLSEPQTELR